MRSQLGQSFHRYGSIFLELVHIVSHTLRVFVWGIFNPGKKVF